MVYLGDDPRKFPEEGEKRSGKGGKPGRSTFLRRSLIWTTGTAFCWWLLGNALTYPDEKSRRLHHFSSNSHKVLGSVCFFCVSSLSPVLPICWKQFGSSALRYGFQNCMVCPAGYRSRLTLAHEG